jgi:hypothetical protein
VSQSARHSAQKCHFGQPVSRSVRQSDHFSNRTIMALPPGLQSAVDAALASSLYHNYTQAFSAAWDATTRLQYITDPAVIMSSPASPVAPSSPPSAPPSPPPLVDTTTMTWPAIAQVLDLGRFSGPTMLAHHTVVYADTSTTYARDYFGYGARTANTLSCTELMQTDAFVPTYIDARFDLPYVDWCRVDEGGSQFLPSFHGRHPLLLDNRSDPGVVPQLGVYVYRCWQAPHYPDVLTTCSHTPPGFICTRFVGPCNGFQLLYDSILRWMAWHDAARDDTGVVLGGQVLARLPHPLMAGIYMYEVTSLLRAPAIFTPPMLGRFISDVPVASPRLHVRRPVASTTPPAHTRRRVPPRPSVHPVKRLRYGDVTAVMETDDEGESKVMTATEDDVITGLLREKREMLRQAAQLFTDAAKLGATIEVKVKEKVLDQDLICPLCCRVTFCGVVRCGHDRCKVMLCFACWNETLNQHMAKIWTMGNEEYVTMNDDSSDKQDMIKVVLDPLDLRVCIPPPKCAWCSGPFLGVMVDPAISVQRGLRYHQLVQCDEDYEAKDAFLGGLHTTDAEWFADKDIPKDAAVLLDGGIKHIVKLPPSIGPEGLFHHWMMKAMRLLMDKPRVCHEVTFTCPYRGVRQRLAEILNYHKKETSARQLMTGRPADAECPSVKWWLPCVLRSYGILNPVVMMSSRGWLFNGTHIHHILTPFLAGHAKQGGVHEALRTLVATVVKAEAEADADDDEDDGDEDIPATQP